MFVKIIERQGLIEMSASFRDFAGIQERRTHDTVPDHNRDRGVLKLGRAKENRAASSHKKHVH